jgi:hypothetical protein
VGINFDDPFNVNNAINAFVKGFFGAFLLWITAFVIGDIILKGAVEDIPPEEIEVLDGGIIQRIHETQNEERVIDSAEEKLTEEQKDKKKEGKKKIKEKLKEK